jgi:hypothetical protein
LALVLAGCSTSSKVSVNVTSNTDGQRIVGSRSLTLAGTLSGGPATAVSVKLNGTAVSGTTHTSSSFSAPLTLADGSNSIVVTATSSAGTSTSTLTLVYPFLTFTDFQNASVVIGQPDMSSNTAPATPTAASEGDPYGNPALINGVLYLPDYSFNRVLGFSNGIPTSNGASADFVLGQANMTSSTASSTADGMGGPQTIVAAGGKMLVDEYDNSRVLIWNTIPTSTQVPADLVVGQPGFGSSSSACTATGLNEPESIFTVNGKLIVADSNNNRVLIYNSIPTSNGATPDIVLGQSSLTSCYTNAGVGSNSTNATAATLDYPSDVWSDGTHLIVADQNNNRVLIWNTFPTSDSQPADVVVGQPDMTSNASAAGATGMNEPYFLASNGNQLFVADASNNRVLIFDGIPTTNGASAAHVLGQSDFTHVTENDDGQTNTAGTPTARTLYYPAGFLLTDQALIVADESNDRYLVFRP